MGHDFHIFSSVFFSQNKFEADWETRKALGGPGYAPPENFWKFTCILFFIYFFYFKALNCSLGLLWYSGVHASWRWPSWASNPRSQLRNPMHQPLGQLHVPKQFIIKLETWKHWHRAVKLISVFTSAMVQVEVECKLKVGGSNEGMVHR